MMDEIHAKFFDETGRSVALKGNLKTVKQTSKQQLTNSSTRLQPEREVVSFQEQDCDLNATYKGYLFILSSSVKLIITKTEKIKVDLGQSSTSGGVSSSHLDNEVCAWLWSRLQDEQEKLKGCQAEREHEIKQVEKYVEDIRALAEERDRLVSQLQEDNRLLKSELIHTKTPTQRMNKWYLEQGNFDRDNLFPLSQLPLPAQFDILLEEQTTLRESFQKLQTLYQSEKNDSDLCRKKLEETVSQQKRLREEFKQYKLEKETEVEILRTDRSSSESTHSKERKGLRKENKNLQNQLLNLQHSKDKESVELRKTIKDLDEETDRLNLECRSLKNNCEQLRLSLELKEEDLQRTRGQLTSSEEKLNATTESHSSDVSILHQTMENILSSRDTESEQLVCSLRAENESLKERVGQFQTDVERNRGEVEGLEERLREAKALCQEKSQETEKIQKLLQTKIASIKDQLQNQESKDKDEIEHLKKEKQKILKEKDSLDTELSRLKKEFEIKVGETEDQIKALQTQLELKEKTIQTLKTTQKALIEEITGFRQEHEELASQLSSLKLGYSSDVTSQSREMEAKNKALREELQQMKEQIRQRNGEIHKLELELNSVRTLLTREKEDNSLVVEKMKKQLTQKDTQVQELMKERQADKERFYEKLQSYKSKREELEEDLDNHSFGSSSHKDNNTSTPKLHRATVGGKNGGGGSGKFSLKDKNELVDMNKENLLEHCLVLQFEMHELLAELDKLTQKQDEDFTRNLQLKSRYKEKCDKLKDQSAKQRQLASEKISSLEHKVTSLNLELSHQTSLRSSVEQMLKRVNEDKRDLSSKLESAVEENKSLSRSLTSSERNLRDWQHENETLKEKLSATVDEKINLERNLKEYEMKLYNGNVSPMNTLRSSGYGNSLSIFASH